MAGKRAGPGEPGWNGAWLKSANARVRRAFLDGLDQAALEHLEHDWRIWARPDQAAPAGDWSVWLFLGGRGAGKTRAGAEWVAEQVRLGARRVALVAPDLGDAREVMIEGPSGLRHVGHPRSRPAFESSRRRLVWPNGAVGYAFSAADPDSLRGPQFDRAWADELASWPHGGEAFDMLRLGLRLGSGPKLCVTTTPRPVAIVKRLLAEPGVVVTRASTRANAANLAPGFLAAMEAAYGASRLARQELDGELVEDAEDAVWTREMISSALRSRGEEPDYVVVGVDPPAGPLRDECGIIVAGASGDGDARTAVVLDDRSLRARPERWARAVADAAADHDAEQVIAEANQGGDMVRAVLHAAATGLPVKLVHASRGKRARAEPIAALYAAGRVTHARRMPELEDQMCRFGGDGLQGSPDRVDALVWALAGLMSPAAHPRMRLF